MLLTLFGYVIQFYHLASVRLQDLCNRLELSEEDLRKKIWTCFEYSIMKHTDLMQDRHLDQILMCAVYVICKVVNLNVFCLNFTKEFLLVCFPD